MVETRPKVTLRLSTMPGPPRRAGLSIGTKLTFATLAVVLAVSALLYRELSRRELASLLAAKETAATMVTDLFAESLSAPLDFADLESVGSELEHLERNPEVLCAAVFGRAGPEPIRTFERGCSTREPVPLDGGGPPRAVFESDRVAVARVVVGRGKIVGSTRVVFSLARENAAFEASRRRLFWLTLFLALGTSGVLIVVSRTQIVAPLGRLAEAARRFGAGDLGARVDVRGGDELGDLARAFNRMSEEIGDRERKLAAATQNLRDLFDHMGQAIVAFDEEGKIRGATSRQATKLFGAADLEGRRVGDLLFGARGEAEVERGAFDEWRKAAFDGGLDAPAAWAEMADLAPKEVTLERPGASPLSLQLEFRPVVKDRAVERVMLLATDLSEQRRLERAMSTQEAAHEKRMAAMRKLVAGGAQLFVRFIQTAKERVAEFFEHVEEGAGLLDLGRVDEMFRHVHTMKGESRAFDLTELEAALEALEDVLAAIRKNAAALEDREVVEDAAAAIRAGLFRAEAAIDRARQDFVAVSPIGAAALEQATVLRSELESVLALARGRNDALGVAVEKLGARPFGEALATIADRVPEWAAREGKRVELVVEGREVRVPRALAELLPSLMTHLVRNAIAHGIEEPNVRVERGKPAVGTIWASIHGQPNGAGLPEVAVEDDGGGIALDAVRARARDLGLDPDLPPADLIFAKGLSTRATSDGLAGRGVGLDAVRAFAHAAGYDVEVVSEPGRGAKFLVRPRAAV